MTAAHATIARFAATLLAVCGLALSPRARADDATRASSLAAFQIVAKVEGVSGRPASRPGAWLVGFRTSAGVRAFDAESWRELPIHAHQVFTSIVALGADEDRFAVAAANDGSLWRLERSASDTPLARTRQLLAPGERRVDALASDGIAHVAWYDDRAAAGGIVSVADAREVLALPLIRTRSVRDATDDPIVFDALGRVLFTGGMNRDADTLVCAVPISDPAKALRSTNAAGTRNAGITLARSGSLFAVTTDRDDYAARAIVRLSPDGSRQTLISAARYHHTPDLWLSGQNRVLLEAGLPGGNPDDTSLRAFDLNADGSSVAAPRLLNTRHMPLTADPASNLFVIPTTEARAAILNAISGEVIRIAALDDIHVDAQVDAAMFVSPDTLLVGVVSHSKDATRTWLVLSSRPATPAASTPSPPVNPDTTKTADTK